MRIAPGTLIAAAFIGPGTVTTATLAGARTGYVLLWGIVFSTVATYVLQEMALRVGVVGRRGLGEALRNRLGVGPAFWAVAALVIVAIGVGNAAYEGGNLSGAALGVGLVAGEDLPPTALILCFGIAAATLLAAPNSGPLKTALAAAVGVMSVVYLGAAVLAPIDWSAWWRGLLPSAIPSGDELILVGLIGTTVVPYNLFLHASLAREHYPTADGLRAARRDAALSIGLGGLVTLAIASLAAAAFAGSVFATGENLASRDLAAPLADSLSASATWVVGIGYAAAGLSSAITAPLAAALAVAGVLGWGDTRSTWRFRAVWASVLLVGVGLASFGAKLVALILLAQVTNGLLLPLIAGLLLWLANDQSLLGDARNSPLANALGLGVVLISMLLGARSLYNVFGG